MKALIDESGVVLDVHKTGFEVHPSWKWIDVPVGIEIKAYMWKYDGANWSPLPVPPPATIEAMKEAQLNQPAVKALIEVLENRFNVAAGTLRTAVKQKMRQ